jgi:hypothetical protein
MGMHTFETYYPLTIYSYNNLKDELFKSGKHHKDDDKNTIIFEKLKNNGIIIKLYRLKQDDLNINNCYNHYSICYVINPRRVMDENNYVGIFNSDDDVDQMVYMVDRYLNSYSKELPEFNDCKLKRVDYCHNIKLNNDEETKQYLKLLKRCMVPTGFEFEKFYDKTAKRSVVSNNGLWLKNNSVTISIYNKKHQLEIQKRNYYGDIMDANGIVRFEIQCKKGKIKKLMQKYDTYNIQDFLNITNEISIDVFGHYFSKMYGTGDILTLAGAERVIKKNKFREETEQLMLELLKNTATYSNLEKSCREFEDKYGKIKATYILKKFDKCKLSPLTKPSRWTGININNPLADII